MTREWGQGNTTSLRVFDSGNLDGSQDFWEEFAELISNSSLSQNTCIHESVVGPLPFANN